MEVKTAADWKKVREWADKYGGKEQPMTKTKKTAKKTATKKTTKKTSKK